MCTCIQLLWSQVAKRGVKKGVSQRGVIFLSAYRYSVKKGVSKSGVIILSAYRYSVKKGCQKAVSYFSLLIDIM